MTEIVTETSLPNIAYKKKEEQLAIIDMLEKSRIHEIRARRIAVNMYENGFKFVVMKFSDKSFDEKYYKVREN